ncbi:MAG: Crp/Fnr family transcriptional regulator [Gemmataceae bacterium]
MSEPAILNAFSSHGFIQGLSEQHRMKLAAGVRPFRTAAGDYLAREDQPAKAFYLVQSGHVAIGTHLGKQGAVPIQTVGPGDIVGWSWLLDPARWQFDARAVDDVQGLAFDADWLRQQCETDHELGYHLLRQMLRVLASRLTATRVQQLDIHK